MKKYIEKVNKYINENIYTLSFYALLVVIVLCTPTGVRGG